MGFAKKATAKAKALKKRIYKTFLVLDRPYVHFINNLKTIAVSNYNHDNLEKTRVSYSELSKKRFDAIRCNQKTCIVTFVLLQFNHFEITKKALESIEALNTVGDMYVVVVDNCSTDGSSDALARYSQGKKNLKIIFVPENKGFACGNNIGYKYAKKELQSDFVIVANNDVTYPDNKFIGKIFTSYSRNQFSILGPDIQVHQGIQTLHQNPMKTRLWMRSEAVEFLYRRSEQIKHLETSQLVPPLILGRKKKYSRKMSGPIVLHGSIYILSPTFVSDMNHIFNEGTFLYGEEDLLATTAFVRGHKMVYDPEICVRHNVKGSTNIGNLLEYYHKTYGYQIDSTKCYLNQLDELEKAFSGESI